MSPHCSVPGEFPCQSPRPLKPTPYVSPVSICVPLYPLCPVSVSPCLSYEFPLCLTLVSPYPSCPPPLLFSDVPFSSVPPSYVPELLIIMFEIQCLCSGSRINTFILTEGENVEMELKTLGLKMFYKF